MGEPEPPSAASDTIRQITKMVSDKLNLDQVELLIESHVFQKQLF